MAYDKIKYNNEYNKNNYERLNIQVPKGMKDYIEARAINLGFKYINPYVNSLIYNDLAKKDNPLIESDEQLIINLYRYGGEEIKKQIFNHVLEIDAKLTQEDKKRMFEASKETQ